MPPDTFTDRLHHRAAQAVDRRLVRSVSTDRARRVPLERGLAFVLATLVHLVTIALLGGAVALLVLSDTWFHRGVGVLVLGVAWLVRPGFLRRLPETADEVVVDTGTTPHFAALVAQVAALVGTPPPDEIRVLPVVNAYAGPRGLRARVLGLGAPLWVAESWQPRLATLAHEIGHFAHGDILRGRYVGSAYATLAEWLAMFSPDSDRASTYGETPVFATIVTAPVRYAVRGMLALFDAVNSAASRRQELLADLAAVQVAGTDAAVSSLELLLAQDLIDVTMNRTALQTAGQPPGEAMGEALLRAVAGYGPAQRAAARARGAEERSRIDASHPLTVDRLRLTESVDHAEPALEPSVEEWATIDAELAPYLTKSFATIAARYRYVS